MFNKLRLYISMIRYGLCLAVKENNQIISEGHLQPHWRNE